VQDDDLLPLSGLQHLAFCPRQCALIHVEREWEENRRTEEGKTLHERVDEGYREFRQGLRQFSGVRVQSLKLGLQGRLDVVEVVKVSDEGSNAAYLGLQGTWTLHPVEFKRGKTKDHDADRVQLCAQAMCLEEMTGASIASGSLFYGQVRRRERVDLAASLRERVVTLAAEYRRMVSHRILPPPVYGKHCRACSLVNVCQPRVRDGPKAEAYRKELLE
jgi:CRISPR-associated exonuclease Cas4